MYEGDPSLVQTTSYTYCACGCPKTTTVTGAGSISGTLGGEITSPHPGVELIQINLSGSIGGGLSGAITLGGQALYGDGSDSIDEAGGGGIGNDSQDEIGYSIDGTGDYSVSGSTITGTVTLSGATVNGTPLSVSGSFSGTINGSGDLSGTFTGTITATSETTSYSYNKLDELTSMTDPNGNTTTYGYDANGNLTSVTNPNGNTATYGYDPLNRLTSVTNASGTMTPYDASNEQADPMDEQGDTTTYSYDAVGNLNSVTDPLGDVTSYTYDGQGRELTETDANGGVTSYTYDLAGNETSLTDPDGNTTTYAYNAANELTTTTNPMGYQSTDAYNAAGLLTSTTDADGRTINYGYNAADEKTSETWVGGNYTATYAYNADGELTSAQDPFSSYSYTYDALGDETSVSNAGTPGVPTVTLDYGYDDFGNRTSLTDSLGGSISYSYDADNQLSSLGLSVSGTLDAQLSFAYDGDGNLTSLTRTAPSVNGDTLTTSYSYDNLDRLTNLTDTDTTQGVTLDSYTYSYDAANQLTGYQDASGNALTYSYDATGQLTSATGTLAGSSYSASYAYDANGNRTSTSTDVGGNQTMATYTTATGNELTNDGTYAYTYDNVGNMTSQTDLATGNVTYYTWDYENRLTEEKVENSQGQVLEDETFTYDVLGNRISESVNGTPQLYTVYDGSNPYLDFNGSGQLTERYLTNPKGLNQFYGQVSADGTTQWFLTDNLNSIRQVVSASGTSLDAITYDPYGNIVSQTNATYAPRFLFTGGAYNALTGTYQDGAREDDPADGRWWSLDPLSFTAGDTNLYRYTFNNPVQFTDPSGEILPIILLVIAGGAAGWYLLGPGAGNAQAPTHGGDIILRRPNSWSEWKDDGAAGIPGAVGGASAGAASGGLVYGGEKLLTWGFRCATSRFGATGVPTTPASNSGGPIILNLGGSPRFWQVTSQINALRAAMANEQNVLMLMQMRQTLAALLEEQSFLQASGQGLPRN